MTSSDQTEAVDGGPGLERTITLTDAVVAIAMTLLVLPLVEIADEVDLAQPREVLTEHWDLLLSFVVSFLVIFIFWSAQGAAYRRLAESGATASGLRQLTMWWLLLIAFLPFPTAVIGRELTTVTAPLYVGTVLVLSVLTSTIAVLVGRATGRRAGAAWITTGVLAVCTVICLVNAAAGMYGLLALVVVRVGEGWWLRRRARHPGTPDARATRAG